MRGTLICVGRPDGRLSALTSLESTVNLSVNQASSIQNLGVTCESMTIGHNPNKLLSRRAPSFCGRSDPCTCVSVS